MCQFLRLNVPALGVRHQELFEELEAMLQDCHIDVNGGDPSFGFTALHRAAANGHLEVCDWLLTKGAEVQVRSKEPLTRCGPTH